MGFKDLFKQHVQSEQQSRIEKQKRKRDAKIKEDNYHTSQVGQDAKLAKAISAIIRPVLVEFVRLVQPLATKGRLKLSGPDISKQFPDMFNYYVWQNREGRLESLFGGKKREDKVIASASIHGSRLMLRGEEDVFKCYEKAHEISDLQERVARDLIKLTKGNL